MYFVLIYIYYIIGNHFKNKEIVRSCTNGFKGIEGDNSTLHRQIIKKSLVSNLLRPYITDDATAKKKNLIKKAFGPSVRLTVYTPYENDKSSLHPSQSNVTDEVEEELNDQELYDLEESEEEESDQELYDEEEYEKGDDEYGHNSDGGVPYDDDDDDEHDGDGGVPYDDDDDDEQNVQQHYPMDSNNGNDSMNDIQMQHHQQQQVNGDIDDVVTSLLSLQGNLNPPPVPKFAKNEMVYVKSYNIDKNTWWEAKVMTILSYSNQQQQQQQPSLTINNDIDRVELMYKIKFTNGEVQKTYESDIIVIDENNDFKPLVELEQQDVLVFHNKKFLLGRFLGGSGITSKRTISKILVYGVGENYKLHKQLIEEIIVAIYESECPPGEYEETIQAHTREKETYLEIVQRLKQMLIIFEGNNSYLPPDYYAMIDNFASMYSLEKMLKKIRDLPKPESWEDEFHNSDIYKITKKGWDPS